ncbi:hypothetical protein N7523_010385 [Penicillium sp. IBT 18751x]|nr:hypothetical protein N7523_010385 [Penicillium sp. IBT 18751x]
MSLPRVSFLEGWDRYPGPIGGRDASAQSDTESEYDLPEPSPLSSSFPSTYSRLNFNPYAGPGWNESSDDREDQPSLLGSLLSPTAARESRVEPSSADLGSGSGPGSKAPWSVARPAYEVSPAKRIVQVCLAVIYCFLAAGIVFGFAAIKPVLIRENVYRNLCSQAELEEDVDVCYGQEIRLNLMFTIAAVATNVSALPVGTILDAYGPRICGLIGSLCLALGAVLFAFAGQLPFDGYIPGYLLLSLGGPFVFISSFQLSNTFPTRSGLILSMLTGAFDASSALFLGFRLLSEHTDGYISSQKFFIAYLIVPIFIATVQITVMPKTSYKTAGELVQEASAHVADEMADRVDGANEDAERERIDRRAQRQSIVNQIQGLLDDGTASIRSGGINDSVFQSPNIQSPRLEPTEPSQPAPIPANTPNTHTSGVWGVLHGRSALQQLCTPWFILITLFTVLMMLRINYFVASLRQQYNYLLDPLLARQINTAFDILLPVGGLLSIPFIGTFLDTFKTRTVLTILVVTATAIGVLGCIPNSTGAAYGNIMLFVLYRPFYYTAVSDYSAKVFGFQTFGKVYGLIICLAGVGNFAQAGLDTLTLKVFGGDPVPVNVVLTLSVTAVGGMLVAFVSWKTAVFAKAGSGPEMRPSLIGNGNGNGVHPEGVMARDWETRPLLSNENERRAYGS